MATPNPRNLVLLLSSGHTVRIALRDSDAPADIESAGALMNQLAAVATNPFDKELIRASTFEAAGITKFVPGRVVMAYIEDPTLPDLFPSGMDRESPNDFQRITVEGPGTVVQYG